MDAFSQPSIWYKEALDDEVAAVANAAAANLQQLTSTPPPTEPPAAARLCKVLKALQAALQHGKAGTSVSVATTVPSLQALLSYGADQQTLQPLRHSSLP